MFAMIFRKIFSFFFSAKSKLMFEKVIFITAILTFIVHFSLIMLSNMGIIPPEIAGGANQNPIHAIYTPFTIILIFEIYLLVYYLPSSITSYLGKQYEVIALIFIRQIFSNLASLSEEYAIVELERLRMLSYDFIGLLVLFLLIFCFYKLSGNKETRFNEQNAKSSIAEKRFIVSKKIMAFVLMLLFVGLFIGSLFGSNSPEFTIANIPEIIKTINNTFFQHLFIALILSEVLLLLFTFNLTDKFHKILRNSGFIISTTLLKISFMTQGVSNMIVVLIAVAFGVAVMGVYRLYDRKLA